MPASQSISQLEQEVSRQFSLPAENITSHEQLRKILSEHITHLLNSDFQQLIFVLYRVDVSEKKLRALLAAHPEENAAVIMADLVLERLLQKIKTRQRYSSRANDFSDEERWSC